MSFCSLGQTKKIAHRSHSGSNHTFSLKLPGNLGMDPTRRIRVAQLDTLKHLGDNRVVMVTSEVCYLKDYGSERTYDTTLWKAGSDTVVDHAIFGEQHKLEWVKEVIKTSYNFKNDIDDVKFIGYDNTEEKSITPKTEGKEPKKAQKERKKIKKEQKRSKKREKHVTSQVGGLSKLTSKNEQVLDKKTQAPKKSEASVSWILILLLIALPSTLAIKAINLKL